MIIKNDDENFFEYLEKVPEQYRQILFSEFVGQILGKSRGELTLRTSLKFSNSLTDDQLKAEVSKITNVPANKILIEGDRLSVRKNAEQVESIIRTYKKRLLEKREKNEGKFEELYDVGRFIVSSGDDYSLTTDGIGLRYPDFILSIDGEKVGLEHTRLVDKKEKELVSLASKHLKGAREIILKNSPFCVGNINVLFNFDAPVFENRSLRNGKMTRDEKAMIPLVLANYILAAMNGKESIKPAFINNIYISEAPGADLSLILASAHRTQDDFSKLIIERINEKEKRYSNYVKESNVKNCILLITVDGTSSYSAFDLKKLRLPEIASSNFKKIILFETFGSTIFNLFQKNLCVQ